MTTKVFTEEDHIEIGGEVVLRSSACDTTDSAESPPDAANSVRESCDDIRVRIGSLLKTENVSFLLGAGASAGCGGPLLGSIPLAIERILQEKGIRGTQKPRIMHWLRVFYLAARSAGGGDSVPTSRDEILARQAVLASDNCQPLPANLERVLASLFRWRSALPESGGRLRIDPDPVVAVNSDDIEIAIGEASSALAVSCNLPSTGKTSALADHKMLLRKLLTRPLNLKRNSIFTLNYDTLVEQAADGEGVVLLDGFVGTQRRVFRPESYEQDLYFPAETTEGRVHRLDRVLRLYKLHGSITWTANEPAIDNPYGVQAALPPPVEAQRLLIYPAPTKYGDVLGMPYAELFRRFAGTVTRPQSVLFVVGYGFGDEHVNAIIRQALAIPSFTLVIVDPSPQSKFVATLRETGDRRVWVVTGPTLGTLAGFVRHILPDLRDEEIREKVLATHAALVGCGPVRRSAPDED